MMETVISLVLFCFILMTVNVADVRSAKDGYVRLVDGSSSGYSGRVEIFHDGQWGTVCDHYWDLADATVVCRWLGYETAWTADLNAYYGPGDSSQRIWLNRVNCTGDEEELSDCVSSDWVDNSCSHSEDAGVSCSSNPVIDGSIRLMDAKDNNDEGRVEIYHKTCNVSGCFGVWGSICNDSWGYDEARIVCNQLRYPHVALPFQIPFYGPGNGPVHLSNVGCTGQESLLTSCRHLQWGENNCSRTNIVGVQCTFTSRSTSSPTTPWIHTPVIPVPNGSNVIMAWWLILTIVVSSIIAVGLIIMFIITLCCVCNSQKRSSNVVSTQGYPTAATISTENPQIDPPPSYSNAMAYDAHTEKAGLEQVYVAQP